MINIKMLLFFAGLLALMGLYLYFVEICRPACLIMWFVFPVYILAGVAIMEG